MLSSRPPFRPRTGQHNPAQAGERTLYLGGRDAKRVACTESALVVQNALGQTLRYPLARVARIVSRADAADWSGAAIALCLQQGISITWTDSRGEALGALHAAQPREPSFAQALELMLETARGTACYEHWHQARRARVFLQCMQGWEESPGTKADSSRASADLRRSWVHRGHLQAHLPAALHGHCSALVHAELARQQLPPLLVDHAAQHVSLADHLSMLLWAQMNLGCRTMADGVDGDGELCTLFEAWAARHAGSLQMHLCSLHRCTVREALP